MRFSTKPQKFLARVRLPAQNLRRIGFGLELRSKSCSLSPRNRLQIGPSLGYF